MQDAEDRTVLLDGEKQGQSRQPSSLRWALGTATLCALALVAGVTAGAAGSKQPTVSPRGLATSSISLAASAVSDAVNKPMYSYAIFTPLGTPKNLDKYLKSDIASVLATGEYRGLLELLVLPGNMWKLLLTHVAALEKDPAAPVPKALVRLQATCRAKMKALPKVLREPLRVHILSPLDYKDMVITLRKYLKADFDEILSHASYDTAKLFSNLCRVRLLGNSFPVIRLDESVLFNYHTLGEGYDGINTVVKGSVEQYKENMDTSTDQGWVISQQYTGLPVGKEHKFLAWDEAYSTQAKPPLLATPDLCNVDQFKAGAKYKPTEDMMDAATDGEVMSKYYGVEDRGEKLLQPMQPSMDLPDEDRLEADILKVGQTYFGPHPMHATISGAGLTMDPAAQLNSAPFLGTDLFVMWIDDHLLDGTVREVLGTNRQAYPKKFIGRAAIVRPIPANPARFTLEFYMPTLTLGCVMAKFVNANPNSYLFRYWDENLGGSSEKLTQRLLGFGVKHHEAKGIYTKALQAARLNATAISDALLEQMKPRLWEDALDRIKDIYWQWSKLPEVEVDGTKTATFASLWVTGRLCKHEQLKVYCSSAVDAWKPPDARFTPKCGSGLVTPAWDVKAKASAKRSALPTLKKADVQPCMVDKIEDLMRACAQHSKWLQLWPKVIQSFWTIPMGKLASDFTWEL